MLLFCLIASDLFAMHNGQEVIPPLLKEKIGNKDSQQRKRVSKITIDNKKSGPVFLCSDGGVDNEVASFQYDLITHDFIKENDVNGIGIGGAFYGLFGMPAFFSTGADALKRGTEHYSTEYVESLIKRLGRSGNKKRLRFCVDFLKELLDSGENGVRYKEQDAIKYQKLVKQMTGRDVNLKGFLGYKNNATFKMTIDAEKGKELARYIKGKGGVPIVLELYAGKGYLAKFLGDNGIPVFAVDNCSCYHMKMKPEWQCETVYCLDALQAMERFEHVVGRLKDSMGVKNLKPYVIMLSPPETNKDNLSLLLNAIRSHDMCLLVGATEKFHRWTKDFFKFSENVSGLSIFDDENDKEIINALKRKSSRGFLESKGWDDIELRHYMTYYSN